MKLQRKILKDMTLLAIFLVFIFLFTARFFIINSIIETDKQRAIERINRLNKYILKHQNILYNLCLDYSKWKETYDFITNKNQDYIKLNFSFSNSFDKNGVNFLFILDKKGNIIYERYNSNSTADEILNKTLKKDILKDIKTYIQNYNKDTAGINNYKNVPTILIIQAVETGKLNKNGYFVVGKYLNEEEISEINDELTIDICCITNIFSSDLQHKDSYIIVPTTFKNIFGKPSITFNIKYKMNFYLETLKNIKIFFLTYTLVIILSTLYFMFKIKKTVLDRVIIIKDTVDEITRTSNTKIRISLNGNDEIYILSCGINKMLDTIENMTKKLENNIKNFYQLAYYDTLTKLPNRNLAIKHIEELIKQNKTFNVILIDIDNFKILNDVKGHFFGDVVLKLISKKLTSKINNGFISRFGGDEFLAVLENDSEIQIIVNNIIEMFSSPLLIKGDKIYIDISMGIASFPKDGTNLQCILKNAEIAMYHAKKNKLNYQYFDTSLNEKALTSFELSNKIKEALENNEFALYYQPIYSLTENKIKSAEALLRLFSKNTSMSPDKFLSIVKDLGLINEINNWVLDNAFKQLSIWNKYKKDFSISINISFSQIYSQDFIDFTKECIKKYKINPKNIIFEITEDETLEDIDKASYILDSLKNIGIKIAIDDFGTGYSSLAYITKLPVDILKIDKSLIKDIEKEKNIEIIKAILSISKTLNFSVVAEGVETQKQLEILKNLKVEKIQGYILDPPLKAYEFETKYIKSKT